MARAQAMGVVGTILLALNLGHNPTCELRMMLPPIVRDASIDVIADWLDEAAENIEKDIDKRKELQELLETLKLAAMQHGIVCIVRVK